MNEVVQKPITSKEEVIPRPLRIVGYNKLMYLLKMSKAEIEVLANSEIIPYARNDEGDPIKGRFDVIDVVRAIIDFNTGGKKASVQSLTGQFEASRVKKMQAQAEREVIQNEMMKGTIVRIEDVNAEVLDMIIAIKGKLLGFPSHVARLILGKEDFDEVCLILTDAMEEALYDLQPPNSDAIRARNRKLVKFTDLTTDDVDTSESSTTT